MTDEATGQPSPLHPTRLLALLKLFVRYNNPLLLGTTIKGMIEEGKATEEEIIHMLKACGYRESGPKHKGTTGPLGLRPP